ncbi:MAG: DUF87 domain-containing protein, partial [Armatimonadetes bacterium]|nr:DUF87 domain-containing protein [Armatimonadota bacterium]
MTNHKRPETYHKVRRSTNASPYDFVPIGARTEKSRALFERVQPHLFWDDPFVSGHQDKPWMHDYLMERYQVDANTEKADPPDDLFAIPIERFGRHTLIVGGSGGGKTRLAMHLVREQLRAGCSLVILDYKDETIRQALAITEEVGLAPENVTLIWPRETSYGIPRWNPLLGESSALSQRVNQFVDIMAGLFANSWGPRLEDILRNATTVIAAQGLSLIELMEFLRNETYRTRLLAQAHGSPAYRQHPEQHRYFEVEFASMSKADKATAVNAVTNKLRVFTTTEYFRALFCDNQQNLNLESLWNRQQVILVHLDTVTLGEPGIRALVGLLTNALYAAALSVEDKNRKRETKPVPVLLTLDELETQERYAGKALTEILN